MHRLTATDTPMVRYTRTIFPSYAPVVAGLFFRIEKGSNPFDLNPLYYSIGQSQTIEAVSTSIFVTTNGNCVWSTSIPYKINDNVCPLGIV